ncbi:MAG: alkene reductase [Candidatus Obscuribacterales bacterium]|jgi:N-ethylmaleimide reductase
MTIDMNIELFSPVKLGSLELNNRIVMSPLTRIRADNNCVPTEMMVRYYSQRASAGLIITEGTHPSAMGRGYTYPPGLHTREQAAGWRKVTDAVHAVGGHIFVQLMHAGRVSHSTLLPNNALPVAPSAIAIKGEIHSFSDKYEFEVPHALETEEVAAVVEEYRKAAELSIEAGFDGVELHAATGYLPNQFQVTGSNKRTDKYGGTLENRSRFTLELLEALCSVRGDNKVGIKIGPGFTVNDTFDEKPEETYSYLADALNAFPLAYVHVGYDSGYSRGTAPTFNAVDLIRSHYKGTLLAVGGFTKESGEAAIVNGRADLIVYGRPFIANPDLVERFRVGAPLNTPDVKTFYGGSEHGYTDYPLLDRANSVNPIS